MKTKKNFITALFLALPILLVAQNNLKEAHQKLTETHKLLVQKHEALNAGKIKDMKKYSDEIGSLISTMKSQESDIERKHTPKVKESVKTENDAIKKNHQAAEARYLQLKEEASKPAANVLKIKEHSKFMISQIKEAEKQNIAMQKKEESVK
jgi:hypothetical protein